MSEIIHVPVTLTMAQTGAAIPLALQSAGQEISAGLGYDVEIGGPPYTGETEVTPDEQEHDLQTAGLVMREDVVVHAIPGDYVGSEIPHRDITDITVSGPDVTVPAGFFENGAGVSVSAGSVTMPTLIEPAEPTVTISNDGTISATVDKTVAVQPGLTPGYVQSAEAGSVTIRGTTTEHLTPRTSADLTVSADTVTAPAGYYANAASATVAAGSATTPTGGITATPTISVDANGLITASVTKAESITPIIVPGYVTTGTAGTVTFSGSATQQMTKRTSADLSASGATVTAPAGYYPASASKAVSAGSATTPATTITATPSISVDSAGLVTASTRATQSITPTVAAGYVSAGTAGSVTVSGSDTLQLDTQGATTITPTTSEQTAVPSGTYTTGDVKVGAMPNGYRGALTIVQGYNSGTNTYTCKYNSATSGYYPASTIQTSGTVTLTQEESTVTPDTTTQTVTPTDAYHWIKKVTVNPIPPEYIVPAGTKSITSNATGIDVTNYAAVDVAVPSGSPNLQDKTVSYTPSETAQADTVTKDAGYDGLGTVSVSVGAISSTYVGSGVTQRTSSDMTESGATVTAPAGYYANAGTKTIASGTATGPAAISSSGATLSTGSGTIILTKNVSVTPSVTPGYIASGTAGTTEITMQATCTLKGAQTYNVTTDYDQTIAAGTYLTGAQTFKKMMLQGKTVTTNGTYTPDAGYNGLGTVIVNVSGGGSVSIDTKTTTASNYPTSLSFSSMKGEPKMFVCRLNTGVSSSGSTTYYYIVEVAGAGTTCHGNVFRIGSTRQVNNITSGYSFAYSGTTLTITSSAASRSASPGAFYNGSYELIYVY